MLYQAGELERQRSVVTAAFALESNQIAANCKRRDGAITLAKQGKLAGGRGSGRQKTWRSRRSNSFPLLLMETNSKSLKDALAIGVDIFGATPSILLHSLILSHVDGLLLRSRTGWPTGWLGLWMRFRASIQRLPTQRRSSFDSNSRRPRALEFAPGERHFDI